MCLFISNIPNPHWKLLLKHRESALNADLHNAPIRQICQPRVLLSKHMLVDNYAKSDLNI